MNCFRSSRIIPLAETPETGETGVFIKYIHRQAEKLEEETIIELASTITAHIISLISQSINKPEEDSVSAVYNTLSAATHTSKATVFNSGLHQLNSI